MQNALQIQALTAIIAFPTDLVELGTLEKLSGRAGDEDARFSLDRPVPGRYPPRDSTDPAGPRERACRFETTVELCCVPGLAGSRHCPPSWVEAFQLVGSSGYWVGHSGECFAAEFMWDRGPGLCARLSGNHPIFV